MITSIVLTGKHQIGLDTSGRFMVGETVVSIKEVPFVRYRFDSFGSAEIDYIGQMKNIFKYSSHMVEITLSENTSKVLKDIDDKVSNIIKYIYVPVNDSHVTDGFDEETLEMLEGIEECEFDRLMLKDNSSTLHSVAASRLKKEIEDIIDADAKEIGICNSPLSFNEDACLTAVKARQLSAEYAENDEVALPSANHECMNNCGCIRYSVISCDLKAPINKVTNKKNGGKKAKTGDKSNKPKAVQFVQF